MRRLLDHEDRALRHKQYYNGSYTTEAPADGAIELPLSVLAMLDG